MMMSLMVLGRLMFFKNNVAFRLMFRLLWIEFGIYMNSCY